MKKINLLLAVLGSCLTAFGSEVTLEGPALKRAVHIANPAVELKLEDALAYKTATQNRSAFYQQKLNWKTGDIKQLIVTARFDNPGRLRFAGQTATPEGKKVSVGVYTDVIPDGKYHDYIFNVSAHPGWKGILTNYELRFMGPENTEFALKKIASSANTVIKYMGKTVKRKILTYKTKDLPCNDTLKTQVTGDFGSFYQQKLAWKSDEINTVSFMLKSDAPGSMRFICMLKSADGKQSKAISMPSQNVPGDNEYHLYTFKLDSHPDFNGTLTNYELRFSGSKNATLELQEMTAEKTAPAQKKINLTAKPAPAAAPAKTTIFTGQELAGADLKKRIQLFRAQAVAAEKDVVAAKIKINTIGGFFQNNVKYSTADYKQLEISLAADAPGYWRVAAACQSNGQQSAAGSNTVAVVPDGKFHTYVFDLGNHHNWTGFVSNWEVRFLGYEPVNIAIKKVRWVEKSNLIANAQNLPVNKEIVTGKLLPRAKCQLNWVDGECPGAVLRFYDRNFKEIPGTAVELKPGEKSVTFNSPEMQIEPRITVNGKSSGYPQLLQLEYIPPRETGNTIPWRGNWLWPKKGPGWLNKLIWFERRFTLDEKPDFGVISAVGDDSCFVYVNGKHLGHTRKWDVAGRYDMTKYLKKGENVILCRVRNIDSWGGLLANVYVRSGNRDLFFDTDEKWTMNTTTNTDRYLPQCKEPAKVIGPASMAPWNSGMEYRHAGEQGILQLIKSEPGKLTVKVERKPVTETKRLRFEIHHDNGNKHHFMLNISPGSDEWKVGETITLTYRLPYFDQGSAKLYCVDDFVYIKSKEALHTFNRKANPPALRRASWVNSPRLRLKMDDEIINPILWHAPGSFRRLAPLANLQNNNFKSYRISARFSDFWKPDGTFDFSVFDNHVATLLTLAPDAVFAVHIYSSMPEWWLKRNPESISTHENNRPRDLWLDHQALGAKKWKTEGVIPLKALYDHIKNSNYADRVWGVSFTENNCGEWFWTSADGNRRLSYAGYSPADLETFKEMLRKWYKTDEALAKAWKKPGLTFDTVKMPSHEIARKGTVGELLDPEKDMMMIDFFKFRSLVLADVLNHFGKFTKEQTDGKWLVGAYYGYFSEMIANYRRNIQSNGHNGFMETVLSPYFDFTHAPLRYTLRKTGQPGALMHVWDPWVLRGKAVFIEQDVRTSYTPKTSDPVYCGTPDRPQNDVGQFIRSLGSTIATGTLNYWYDLDGGQFDEKAINDAVTATTDVFLSIGDVQGTTPFEVCVVNSRDSVWYTKYADDDNPTSMASEFIYKHVNQLAVPFRNLMVYDLLDSKVKLEKLKFYIMHPMIMLTAGQRKKLMERFEREKAVVVWLYSAGASYPTHGPSAKNNGDFLGIKFDMKVEKTVPKMTLIPEFNSLKCENYNVSSPWFYPVSGYDRVIGRTADGKPALVEKKINGATHYFSTLTNLPLEFYAKLMDQNNIHRYSKTVNKDQYWIGNDVVFLHATGSGDRLLNLPEGTYAKGIAGPVPEKLNSGEKFKVRSGMTYGFQIIKK